MIKRKKKDWIKERREKNEADEINVDMDSIRLNNSFIKNSFKIILLLRF